MRAGAELASILETERYDAVAGYYDFLHSRYIQAGTSLFCPVIVDQIAAQYLIKLNEPSFYNQNYRKTKKDGTVTYTTPIDKVVGPEFYVCRACLLMGILYY